MKFTTMEGSASHVLAVPSDPEGMFVVHDPFSGDKATGQIMLNDIKPRHVRALQRGDDSAMSRYYVTDPNEPGAVHFTKGSPGVGSIYSWTYAGNAHEVPPPPEEDWNVVPEKRRRWWSRGRVNDDAAQADATHALVSEILHPFKGGVEDLKPVSEAADVYQAVGLWWAHFVLSPVYDTGDGIVVKQKLAAEVTAAYEAKIGGFAAALASVSAKGNLTYVETDYHPDSTLLAAAALSDLPQSRVTFPMKSYTHITDGVVMARAGRSAEPEQIWPPTDPSVA